MLDFRISISNKEEMFSWNPDKLNLVIWLIKGMSSQYLSM